LTIAAVNVIWLFPLALGACVWQAAGPLFAEVALVPLVYMALRYGAGRKHLPQNVRVPKLKSVWPSTRRFE